jgi:hypothetical protein
MTLRTNRPSFLSWVCSRRALDNPRGDFIRDTRDLSPLAKAELSEPLEHWPAPWPSADMCAEAFDESIRLWKAYKRFYKIAENSDAPC